MTDFAALAEAIERDRADGTPGPWDWEVNRSAKHVELCGGKGGHDLTVMSFSRYGMFNAAPVFWFWNGNVSDEPKRADKLAIPEPGREHHDGWFSRIDHPDARRIARVPTLETACLELWARVQALEGAIATHGAEACGILRAYHEEDGRRLWLALRAALQPPETDQ